MFGLISIQPIQRGINIPVFGKMTNGDVAAKIEANLPLFKTSGIKQRLEVETFVQGLKNTSDGLYIDPCYDTCPDAFVLGFGFE